MGGKEVFVLLMSIGILASQCGVLRCDMMDNLAD